MATSQFLTNAVRCVKTLQKERKPDAQIFQDPRNSLLASSMTALSQNARHIQDLVQRAEDLAEIEMVVACKIRKPDGRSGTRTETFVLWSTMLDHTQASRENEKLKMDENNNQREGDGEISNAVDGISVTRNDPRASNEPATGDQLQKASPYQETPARTSLGPADKGQYNVPVDIATKCLQLLLDGSGFTSHRSCLQQSAYVELNSKTLVEVVHKLFDAEKTARKVSPNDTANCSRRFNSSSSRRNKEMIYMDLLPNHLRSDSARTETSLYLPEVRIEYHGAPKVLRTIPVTLNIKKPDRNRKDTNFALLCALLHHTGISGTCNRVLQTYAREGLSAQGCERRMKFCASSSSQCGGFARCKYARRTICMFYKSAEHSVFGKGTVDPFTKVLDGTVIEKGFIAVRFGYITTEQKGTANNILEHDRDKLLRKPVIWSRSLIGRVTLFGDYEKVLGTAILVEDQISKGLHKSIERRMTSSSRKKGTVDVSNAIVICDVRLKESSLASQERYPYAEWYNVPCLRGLKNVHFGKAGVPDHLDEQAIRGTVALLWHRNYFKREPIER